MNKIVSVVSGTTIAIAVAVSVAAAPLAVAPAYAQYDLGGSYGGGTYDLGGGYSGSTYDLGGSYGGSTYDLGGSYGGSTYDLGGGYGGSTYDLGGGYGGSTYDLGGGYSGSTYDLGGGYGGSTYDLGGGYSGSTYDLGGGYGGGTYNLGGGYNGGTYSLGGGYNGGTYDLGGLYSGGGSTYGSGTLDNTYGSGSVDNTYGSGTLDNTYGSGSIDNGGCSTCTYGVTDVYGNAVTTVGGVGYSYNNYGVYTGGYGGGFTVAAPHSTPVVVSAPSKPGNVTTVTNTCTGNSCNTSTTKNTYNYTDNSVNNSGNTTISGSGNTTVSTVKTVASGVPTYNVQYTYPSYYPSYNYGYNYGYYQAPTCSITINYGYAGGPATLTWSIYGYVTSAYISPSVGYVPAQQGTQTRTINPTYGTVYTMGVSGPGGSNNCQTQIHYQPQYVPQTSVSLSQIPYTGFDFGPVGNTIYWLSLLMFALAGAYLMVYYRGGMFTLAAALVAPRNPKMAAAIEKPAEAMQKAVAPIAKRIERALEPLRNLPTGETKPATQDRMVLKRSNGTEAPRIVISRE